MPKRSILFFLLLTGFACSQPKPQPEAPDAIILQMNDVYEISPLEGGEVGGLARVATLRKHLLEEAPVVTILSGDFLSPSLTGTLKYQGKKIAGLQMVEALNALGLDYVTFGNHEFDLKESELLSRIDSSDFTWISTNTFHVAEGDTLPFTQRGEHLPKAIVQPLVQGEDTLRLLWVGTCLPFNQKDYVAYAPNTNSVEAALSKHAGQYDVPLAITHWNWYEDTAFARQLPQFPIILGGHDHENMLVPVGESVVAKADANAKTVYVHRIWWDTENRKARVTSELVPITDSLEDDPVVQEVVEKWGSIANSAMTEMGYDPDKVVVETQVLLDGREASIRNYPTNLGVLSAEAMLWADTSAEVALLNSGSIRLDDQLTGTISMYDILRTFPFGGGIVYTQMTGAELTKVLDIGIGTNQGLGGYLQVCHIDTLSDGEYTLGTDPLQPARSYRVVMPEFLSTGGESNLAMLGDFSYQAPTAFHRDTLRNDIRDIVAGYMETHGVKEE